MQNLHEDKSLEVQLQHAFSYPYSPNWQDSSTEAECNLFDQHLGDENELAIHTGSKAHHVRRSSAPHTRVKRPCVRNANETFGQCETCKLAFLFHLKGTDDQSWLT